MEKLRTLQFKSHSDSGTGYVVKLMDEAWSRATDTGWRCLTATG
jgi:hypothetical protein